MAYSVAKKKDGYSTSDKCFMPENGKVIISIPDDDGNPQTFEFPVYDGLWITDVCLYHGKRTPMSKGVQHTYIACSVYKEAFTDEFKNSRDATIYYLQEIEEAVQNGCEYVDSVFGLKRLTWYGNQPKSLGRTFDRSAFTKA